MPHREKRTNEEALFIVKKTGGQSGETKEDKIRIFFFSLELQVVSPDFEELLTF